MSPRKTSSKQREKSHAIVPTLVIVLVVGLSLLVIFVPLQPVDIPEEVCDLIDNDGNGLVDEGFITTCYVDEDCGPSGQFDTFCKEDELWELLYIQTCGGEVGTCLSTCTGMEKPQFMETCTNGCLDGACLS